jgi:hypothetical protein
MPFRGDAVCFTFGVMGINKGRFGQLGADGAAFVFRGEGGKRGGDFRSILHECNPIPP